MIVYMLFQKMVGNGKDNKKQKGTSKEKGDAFPSPGGRTDHPEEKKHDEQEGKEKNRRAFKRDLPELRKNLFFDKTAAVFLFMEDIPDGIKLPLFIFKKVNNPACDHGYNQKDNMQQKGFTREKGKHNKSFIPRSGNHHRDQSGQPDHAVCVE